MALCDLVAPLTSKIKQLAGDDSIREYTDYRKMLDDGGFEAVLVVTEPEYQPDLCVAVMEAGKDVFSEVPAAFTLEACWKLVLTAERTGRTYYLGEQVRHTPLMRFWRQCVQGGALGTILFAEGHYLHARASDRFWRNPDTGELLTWEQAQKTDRKVKTRAWTMAHPILYGPHEMSPFLKVLDDRVVSVFCCSSGSPSKRYKEVPMPCMDMEFPEPDIEVALMQTAKGTIIRFAAGFHVPVSESHWYHLFGTKGEMETRRGSGELGYSYRHAGPVTLEGTYRFARTQESWFHPHGRPPEEIAASLESELTPAARKTGHGGSDYYPLADFVHCIRDGATPDIDVYQAVATAAPCIMAAQSAEQGGANLAVPDFRPGPHRRKGERPA